tara:strand:+ start:6863 stop:7825 length:963 start_codon:yes stop_codon:yes gene_type:complete
MGFGKRGNGLLIVSVLLIISVFVSGCQPKTPEQLIEGPFAGGSSGLNFAFQEGEPPATVLDNGQQEFFVTLVVRNSGEYTVPAGSAIASLSGVDADAFGLSSLNVVSDVEIQGVSKDDAFVISGAEELLEFPVASYVNDILAGSLSLTLRSDLCYGYNTQAITNLCLKKDVLKESIEDVCSTNNPSMQVYNSGAPVQVVDIRQSAVGTNKIKVTFNVVNVGGGLVYLPGSFTSTCQGHDDEKDMLLVTLTNPQNNFVAECSALGKTSSGDIRLINGKKEVSCTIETNDMQEVTFQDLLVIDLSYMYRESVITSLVVKNAL